MKRAVILLFCALLLFAFVACGGSAGGGSPLANYMQEYGQTLQESMAPLGAAFGEGGSVDIFVEGDNDLVFVFVYDHNLPEEIMPVMIETMAAFFQPFAEGLREELELPQLRVIARYIDTNDNLFEEQVFN